MKFLMKILKEFPKKLLDDYIEKCPKEFLKELLEKFVQSRVQEVKKYGRIFGGISWEL